MSGSKVVIRETLRAPLQNSTVKLSDHQDLLERVNKLEENYNKVWEIVKKLLPDRKDETSEATEATEMTDNKVKSSEVSNIMVVSSVDDTIQQNINEMKHQELDILGELKRQQLEDLDSVETSEEPQPQLQLQPQNTSEHTTDPATTVPTMTAVETVVLPDTPVTSPTKVEEMHDILDMIESSGQKDDHQKPDESSLVDHQKPDESSQKNNNVVSSHKEDNGDESPQKKSSDEEEVSEEEASESESSEEENNESGDESD